MLDTALEQKELEAAGKKVKNPTPRHITMEGPPGTGKTTVANELAKIMHDMGIIEKEKVTVVDPNDIKTEYKGESEKKMRKLYNEAEGGVLVIDEAHQFAQTDYGKDALRALIAPMGDPNGKTMVVFAGYEGTGDELAKVDPGFTRRVGTKLDFQRFSSEQLEAHMAEEIEDRQDMRFASGKAYDAMATAMEAVGNNPEHGSLGDVQRMFGFANKARLARLRQMGPKAKTLPIEKRRTFQVSDWKKAQAEYEKGLA